MKSFIQMTKLELALQDISDDKTTKSNTVQDLKGFNSQVLATQAKIGNRIVSKVLAIKKVSGLMGDDTAELSTENQSLKNKIDSYDKKSWNNLKQSL